MAADDDGTDDDVVGQAGVPAKLSRYLVRRSAVTPGRPHGDYREPLRRDFWFACAYCTMTELEAAAVGFEIDHWRPQSAGGSDDYGNLYWACAPCNQKKKGYWPQDEEAAERGQRILRVDVENPEEHIGTDANAPTRVVHKSPLGEFNINLLGLNMARMVKIRSIRQSFGYNAELIRQGLRMLSMMRIDELPSGMKAKAIAIRERLKQGAEDALEATEKVFEGVAEELSKSPILAIEESDDSVRERVAYLRSVGVHKQRAPKRR